MMAHRTGSSRSGAAIAIVALAFLAAGGALYAQQLTGNIYGSVTDESGGRLPGVTVTLTGGGAPQTFTTDSRGEFRFLNLAPGDRYTVSYELPGFVKTTRTNVAVSIGRNTQADVGLKLAKIEAAVTVRAEAPLLETRKVVTGAVVDQAQLREIPTARDPWVVLQTVPGVMVDRLNVGGNYSGQQSLFYAKGALGNQSTFNLDGVNITDMAALGSSGTYYDFDSFEEIQATTGGSDITAFTPGVQLNLVTKRGTNDVHGSARDLLTRQKWQSKNASSEFLAQPAGTNIPPRTDTIQDYGVEVGGPIWRDHLWAWGSYGRNQIDLITSTGATDKTTLEDANLKLNLQATESTAVTFGYTQGDKSKLGRNVGLTRPTSNEGWNQSGINGNPSALDKVEVSQVISSNLFLTASYAYFRGGFQLLPGSGDAINNLYRDDTNGNIYHNGYYTYRTQRPLHNAGTNGSFFFNTGQVGNELKFGFSYRKGGVVSTTTWPGNGNYGILGAFGVGKDAAELTRAASLKGTLQYWNAYLGDTISVGNLTVNAGLRYDVQSGYNQAGSSGANPIIPEVLPAIAGSDSPEPFKWKNWSPRVGATYALGDARKVVLKASYARFADQLGIGTLFNVNATQLAGVRYYWTDANGDKVVQRSELDFTKPAKCAGCPSGVQSAYGFDPKNPASPSSPNIIDPNLKAGKTDEVVAGVDYEVLPEFVVGASYTYRKYTDPIFTYRNGLTASSFVLCTTAVRSVCPTNGFINGTTKSGTGFSVPIYTLNPSTLLPASVLTTNRPDFDTTYNGIELTMQKRLSNKWMVRGNFGFQNWKQHAGSGSCAQLDPTNLLNGTFGAGCPGDDIMVGPSGTGSGATGNIFVNSKWNFNIAGLYQLPLGFNVGANFFGRQGYPYVQWVSINTGDGYGTKNVVVPPLDQQRNPNIFDADIRLEKVIELRPLSISLSLDVFNVANSATVLQRQGKIATCSNTSSQPSCSALVPNGSYNLITDFQSPRVVRAGARISF
jgi:hypothetical protein